VTEHDEQREPIPLESPIAAQDCAAQRGERVWRRRLRRLLRLLRLAEGA
jgi:hypothetical protein